jgi:hypothetical protein
LIKLEDARTSQFHSNLQAFLPSLRRAQLAQCSLKKGRSIYELALSESSPSPIKAFTGRKLVRAHTYQPTLCGIWQWEFPKDLRRTPVLHLAASLSAREAGPFSLLSVAVVIVFISAAGEM